MICADRRELLVEYSLGHLDASRAREVREHIQGGCEMCARELAEIEDSWATMAANLEPVAPSPEIEARLLAMIRGEVVPSVARSVDAKPSSNRRSRVLVYVLAASLAGVAAATLAMKFTPLSPMLAQQQAEDRAAATWGQIPSQHTTSGFQTVALNTIAEKRGVHVSVVMIPQSKEWHVIATGLPALEEGESFHVWLEQK